MKPLFGTGLNRDFKIFFHFNKHAVTLSIQIRIVKQTS